MIVCTSCKTSYNVLSHSHVDRIVLIRGSGSWGGVVVDIRSGRGGGGVMQKKESPEFRFLEVNISARERETL